MAGYVETLVTGHALVRATNSSDASFPTRVSTVTKPSGDGVIDLSRGGNVTRNALRVKFFGTDAADETFKARILGWNHIPRGSAADAHWDYIVLAEVTCTLGTKTGVANTLVNASQFWVDTIVLATGYNTNVSVEIVSPANNEPAHIILDTKGCELAEVIFDMNSSAATANAVYGGL